MSIGFARPACGGQEARAARRASAGPAREARARAPRRRRRAGCRARPALVTTPTRGPGGHRLRGEQRGHVEQLLERVGADHAGLLEERVDGDVEARERRRVARRRARAGRGAPRLDRDDRLAARDLGGDAREPARIAEALEVEDDHLGARVVGPVAEQVVARDVGLVADRHERRDADVRAART